MNVEPIHEDKEVKNLAFKIIDYKRFSFLFLFLAAFLYVGSVIPFDGKTLFKTEILIVASLVTTLVAMLCYWRMQKAKETLKDKLNS